MFSFKLFLFLTSFSLAYCVSLEDTELLLTFVVFRHGERTPIEDQIYYSDDPTTLEELTTPWGYGNLIDKGKQRGFHIGEFLRERYGGLLSEKYNATELYFRSTDVDRTKMTGLTAMAALYPPVGARWSQLIHWNPVPYTTVPSEYDFLEPYESCDRYANFFIYALYNASLEDLPEMAQYEDLIVYLTNKTEYNFTSHPSLLYTLFDTYQCEIGLGMTLKDWVLDIYNELVDATNTLSKRLFGTPGDSIRLNGGYLLNDFLNVSKSIISGDKVTQRVRLYSAHDINVAGQMAAARVLNGFQKFGATFAMELRKNLSSDQYYVLPVHILSPGESVVEYLQVDGCSDILCDFDEFVSLTSEYAVNQTEFDYLCSNGDAIEL